MLPPFEVIHHVFAVLENTAPEHLLELRVKLRARRAKQIPRHHPVRRANRHIHRALPVHAEARRIRRDEIQNLIAKLAQINRRRPPTHVARITRGPAPTRPRQRERVRQLRQMLHPRQFPRHLHVHARLLAERDVPAPRRLAPAKTRLEIHVPVDRLVAAIHQRPNPPRLEKIRRRHAPAQPFARAIRRHARRRWQSMSRHARALHPVLHAHPTRAEQIETMLEKTLRQFANHRRIRPQ